MIVHETFKVLHIGIFIEQCTLRNEVQQAFYCCINCSNQIGVLVLICDTLKKHTEKELLLLLLLLLLYSFIYSHSETIHITAIANSTQHSWNSRVTSEPELHLIGGGESMMECDVEAKKMVQRQSNVMSSQRYRAQKLVSQQFASLVLRRQTQRLQYITYTLCSQRQKYWHSLKMSSQVKFAFNKK